jgi:hypothetical protein
MARHKRKGSDPIPADKVTISSSPGVHRDQHQIHDELLSSKSSSWFQSTLQRLEQLQLQIENDYKENKDEKTVVTMHGGSLADADIRTAETELVQIADSYKSQLQQRLDHEQSILQHESEELYQQRVLVQQLQSQRDDLLDDIARLEEDARVVRHDIHQYQQDSQQLQQEMDQMEEDESRRLLRLQHEVSLYASATGLKWYSSAMDEHDGVDHNGKNNNNNNNNNNNKVQKHRLLKGDVVRSLFIISWWGWCEYFLVTHLVVFFSHLPGVI